MNTDKVILFIRVGIEKIRELIDSPSKSIGDVCSELIKKYVILKNPSFILLDALISTFGLQYDCDLN